MTFAVLATDGGGRFGMAVSSSSPAVGARCIHLRPGVGGAASQNITDPRLGTRLLDAVADLGDASAALEKVRADTPDVEYRQLMVVDGAGGTASFSGAHTLGLHASAVGPASATGAGAASTVGPASATVGAGAAGEGVVAAGNLLASEGVPAAMVAAFTGATGELEQRLVAALAAGLAAGGEAGPVRSAGLAVVADVAWRVTDLRVDWHDDPVGELARLVALWLPQRDDYVSRALAPSSAPSYGVPGDE
ncbi:MAG: hypothetical protein QOC75_1809 [Pseudonocardiales bacterium]|nr:hypothetical protein [Pseudonocardiales bacterium]